MLGHMMLNNVFLTCYYLRSLFTVNVLCSSAWSSDWSYSS